MRDRLKEWLVGGRVASTHGSTVIIDWMARASSYNGGVVMGAGGGPTPILLGEGRP
jgi:hypothetical protein